MTQSITTPTEFEAFALEVDAILKAAFEGLADIEARAKAVQVATEAAHTAAVKVKVGEESEAAYNNDRLASGLVWAVERAREGIESYRKQGEGSFKRWAEAQAEREWLRAADANAAVAATTAAIPSGIQILTANVILDRSKPTNRATVLYMLGDKILEATVKCEAWEDTFEGGWDRNARPMSLIKNAEGTLYQHLFRPTMTAEDIGKAVDIREKVCAAARAVVMNAQPKRRR